VFISLPRDRRENRTMNSEPMHGASADIESIERGKWANKTEFLLSCMGYAIGLGNIWRFPYLCYNNGGGAFLIPYLLMLVVFGIPLYYMEVALGQFGSVGCLTMFKMAPILKGAGYAMIFVNTVVMLYFNVIVAYPILYLFRSFTFSELPWARCNNAWNTPNCYELSENVSSKMLAVQGDAGVRPKSSADEYFK
jgi:solute carrier family 6 (neurotransmitter transporter, glycine) member 5/9